MIDRVEVLTGGASSVYGADAVAGVVNFIMDTDFEGIRLDSQYSFYQHENNDRASADGLTCQRHRWLAASPQSFRLSDRQRRRRRHVRRHLSFGVGFDDGRGHITAYSGYRNIDPVLQGKRDYSACAPDDRRPAWPPRGDPRRCGGSATANGTAHDFRRRYDGTSPRPRSRSGRADHLHSGCNLYNFAPLNYFQRPDERYIGGVFAEYEISPAIKPYMEFMFMDDRTVAQIAPSGDFGNTLTPQLRQSAALGAAGSTSICGDPTT